MATQVITDADILIAGYDVKTDSNKVTVQKGRESRDPTVFGMKTRRVKAGMRTASMSLEGLFQAGASPEQIDDILAQVDEGQLVSAWHNRAAGNVGHAMLVSQMEHEPFGGAVGDLAPFNVGFEPTGEILKPTSLFDGIETASGNGSALQLGAVGAAQRITGIIHVLAASGTSPTLDATIESDDGSGFASPVTRITFPQLTAAGINGFSVPAPVNGAITDDWWRAAFTIGGTSPSFTFVVGLFIGPQP